MKGFIGRRMGQGSYQQKGKKDYFQARTFSFCQERIWRWFYPADTSSSSEGCKEPMQWITSLMLTKKAQTGWLTLHFWCRLKLQVGQVLNLDLVSWVLAQDVPFRACGFSHQHWDIYLGFLGCVLSLFHIANVVSFFENIY